jgi:protein CrcB
VGGAFPWGTVIVNITGAFLLGLLFTVLTERFAVTPWVRTAVTVGLVGGYTTFSTQSLETFRLMEDGAYLLAASNAFGSLARPAAERRPSGRGGDRGHRGEHRTGAADAGRDGDRRSTSAPREAPLCAPRPVPGPGMMTSAHVKEEPCHPVSIEDGIHLVKY